MRVKVHRHLRGQTPVGVFTNYFDRVDRDTVGGWYVDVHVGTLRISFIGMNPKGWNYGD